MNTVLLGIKSVFKLLNGSKMLKNDNGRQCIACSSDKVFHYELQYIDSRLQN